MHTCTFAAALDDTLSETRSSDMAFVVTLLDMPYVRHLFVVSSDSTRNYSADCSQ